MATQTGDELKEKIQSTRNCTLHNSINQNTCVSARDNLEVSLKNYKVILCNEDGNEGETPLDDILEVDDIMQLIDSYIQSNYILKSDVEKIESGYQKALLDLRNHIKESSK